MKIEYILYKIINILKNIYNSNILKLYRIIFNLPTVNILIEFIDILNKLPMYFLIYL